MEIQVVDKETGRLIWKEQHKTQKETYKALQELQENYYNPDYFIYKIKN